MAAIAVSLILALGACSLGTSTSSNNTSPGVAGFAKGVITAKGSVFVNGVEYDDSTAAISVDDSGNHTDADLKVGMVVEVQGTIDSASGKGTATTILYSAELEGTIDTGSINTTAGTFTVFGQTVITDANTVFEGVADITGLASGDRVEVSGIADPIAHTISATRVEKKTVVEDYRIKGTVSNLAAGSFDLTTEHSSTPIIVNFTGTLASGITNGSEVVVRFATFSNPISTTAAQVRLLRKMEAENGERVEASGIISNFAAGASSVTFTVHGMNVQADNALVAGLSLANGVKVEVKGTMNAGVLVAQKVSAERESRIGVRGTAGASPIDTVNNTLTLDGIVFSVTSTTIFRDESAAHIDRFSLADIAVGDPLQVNAYIDGSGNAIASRIERAENPITSAVIQAPVSATATNQLTMLGLTVDISGVTFTPDQATFLTGITLNSTIVRVTGSVTGTTFVATQASIAR
jgi:hypothetical protein